jgi:hypothetical protein
LKRPFSFLVLFLGFVALLAGCGNTNGTTTSQNYVGGWTAALVQQQIQQCIADVTGTPQGSQVKSVPNFCNCLTTTAATGAIAYADYIAEAQSAAVQAAYQNIVNTCTANN